MAENDANQLGQLGPMDTNGENNAVAFQIKQWVLSNVTTMKPVKVVAVYGPDRKPLDSSAAISAIGFVDVQPLVRQMNSGGYTQPHGIIQGVPYVRAQGGKVAIVIDPKVGDVGHMVCSDRDMSAVKSNRGAESPPGSFRSFDPADGIYQGCFSGEDAPEAYFYWKNDDHWFLTPDKGETYLSVKKGVIVIWADKVIIHGETLVSTDANGLGSVLTGKPSFAIDNYTTGVTPSPHVPEPPAVPPAHDNEETS